MWIWDRWIGNIRLEGVELGTERVRLGRGRVLGVETGRKGVERSMCIG